MRGSLRRAARAPEPRKGQGRGLGWAWLAVAAAFLVSGASSGSWAPRIPEIKARLGLSAGELGLVLLGGPVGGMLGLPAAPPLLRRLGNRRVVVRSGLVLLASLPLLALAPSPPALAAALALAGGSGAVLEVAMNAAGVEVERLRGRPVMASLHAGWSAGAMLGAAGGGALAQAGMAPAWHLALVSALLAAVLLLAASRLLPGTHPPRNAAGAGGGRLRRPGRLDRRLAALGVIAFCSFFAEIAVADWSAVWLREARQAGPALAAAGFAAFALAMAASRLVGDLVTARLGRRRTLRASGLLAGTGMALALATPAAAWAVAGFALAGVGFSCVVPLAFSSAGNATAAAGSGLAAVTAFGYLGWLAGPPLVGGAAELLGLDRALALLAAAGALIALLAPAARDPDPAG